MSNSSVAQPASPKSTVVANAMQGFRRNLQTYTIIVALILIWIVFAIATDGGYLSPQNISNLFRQMSVTSIMAAGMVLVIVTGGIDLSVGSVIALASVLTAWCLRRGWDPVPSAIAASSGASPAESVSLTIRSRSSTASERT